MAGLLRAVVWRSLGYPGAEYCTLSQTTTGYRLEGHVVVAFENNPFCSRYRVICDLHWRTRAVAVELLQGVAARRLQITIDDDQRWWVDGREIEQVRGCQDVDLAITPSTNTLPIRRLNLDINSGRDVTAAWLRFPELELEPLPQTYTRIGATSYRYESRSGSFSSELDVDDLGLVVRYAQGWQREAVALG
jgi:hypothetical protein